MGAMFTCCEEEVEVQVDDANRIRYYMPHRKTFIPVPPPLEERESFIDNSLPKKATGTLRKKSPMTALDATRYIIVDCDYLEYYKNKLRSSSDDKELRGRVDLRKFFLAPKDDAEPSKICLTPNSNESRPNHFFSGIVAPQDSYTFFADDEKARDEWATIIEAHIKHARQENTQTH